MKLFEKFQTLMAAAAFAEEDEHAIARQVAAEAQAPAGKARETRTAIAGTLAVDHGK